MSPVSVFSNDGKAASLKKEGELGLKGSGLAEQATADDAAPQEGKGSQLVRVEANFLRLPLFALDNKHMRRMDGIQCEGFFRRGTSSFRFTFVATRNSRTLYPGPVARSAHLAILSLATERAIPIQNPIVFSWRGLLARIGVVASGRTVQEVKQALIATKGLMIESQHALYSKAAGKPLDTSSEMDRIVGIYDELEFFGNKRKDETIADINAVWLSRWYLDNLNALYSGPLNYDLWRSLDARSPIASRLYEFLFFKFYVGRETLRFNYPNLVKFIPARRERYPSDAKKQLNPAFDLLKAHGVLADVRWSVSRHGDPQILLIRGDVLNKASQNAPASYDVGDEDFVLDRIQNVRLPEQEIVEEYHERFGHADYRPSKAEVETARELLAKHGKKQLRELLPLVVKHMKEKWPDAKSFVAVTRYMDEAVAEHARMQRRQNFEQEQAAKEQAERVQVAEKAKREAALKLLWQHLAESEREDIRATVLRKQPASLKKYPALIERFCLEEFARRRGGPPSISA